MLTLPTICDRAAARALHPDIRDAVGNEPLAIDASEVERIGQAMLQLLVSAANTDAGITIESPSTAVIEAMRTAGLETVLGEDIKNSPVEETAA